MYKINNVGYNKKNGERVKRKGFRIPGKPLFISLIILLALCFVIGYIWRILTTSEYFQVKDIISKEDSRVDLSYLKGKNIFNLDLSKESLNIIKVCPDCSRIRLARILPNRIYVEFVKRKPVAFIRLNNYLAVDEWGVVFYASVKPDESDLPIILGLESKITGPKSGKRYEFKELLVALDILKEARRNPLLRECKISKIDVSDIDNIAIQMPFPQKSASTLSPKASIKSDFLVVKISQGNISEKIVIMAGLINQEKQNLEDIKYIDLRFREPVIKFKDK